MATAQKEKTDFSSQASHLGDQAKEMASDAGQKAKEMGSSMAGKAGEAASFVGKKAEETTSAVGSGMKSLAGTIRESTPSQGMLGSARSAVADTLESGGRYLQEHGLQGIGEEMSVFIRRNPIPALLIGIGLGFLVARATTSRS